jgi:hypothetical protein
MEAHSPDGPEALSVLPLITCFWSPQPMPGFPEGSLYSGNLVARPVEPAEFITRLVLPFLRKDLKQAQVVKTEELPDLAKTALAGQAPEAGIQKSAKAARIRFRYDSNGVPVEEDVYCALVYATGGTGVTFWAPQVFFTFRAKAGELDAQARILAVIESSARVNLNWYNRLMQMIEINHQAGMQRIHDIGEWSKAYAKTSGEVSDSITKGYWDRQASQARTSQAVSNSIRGVEQYKDPQGYEFQLPSGYDGAWVSNRGEVIVSNEPGFDPGVTFKEDWHPLTRQ